MPPKKAKKPRAKRGPAKKSATKQKQKQRQVVNVQVSGGGSGGGGTQFIPMPQAPSIDYNLLSQLIRPANTVDVPIRAAAPIAESIAVRPAEEEPLRPAMAEPRPDLPASRRPFAGETEEDYSGRMALVEERLAAKSTREKQQRELARGAGIPTAVGVSFVEESGSETIPTTVRVKRGGSKKSGMGGAMGEE
jgi:hypothetical protein